MQGRFIEICLDRMRPKLAAIANVQMNGQDFASMLDRAISRSNAPLKLIEAAPVEHKPVEQQHSASELKGPMSQFRRW
jgi:hypothetical protein